MKNFYSNGGKKDLKLAKLFTKLDPVQEQDVFAFCKARSTQAKGPLVISARKRSQVVNLLKTLLKSMLFGKMKGCKVKVARNSNWTLSLDTVQKLQNTLNDSERLKDLLGRFNYTFRAARGIQQKKGKKKKKGKDTFSCLQNYQRMALMAVNDPWKEGEKWTALEPYRAVCVCILKANKSAAKQQLEKLIKRDGSLKQIWTKWLKKLIPKTEKKIQKEIKMVDKSYKGIPEKR